MKYSLHNLLKQVHPHFEYIIRTNATGLITESIMSVVIEGVNQDAPPSVIREAVDALLKHALPELAPIDLKWEITALVPTTNEEIFKSSVPLGTLVAIITGSYQFTLYQEEEERKVALEEDTFISSIMDSVNSMFTLEDRPQYDAGNSREWIEFIKATRAALSKRSRANKQPIKPII